MSDTRLVTLAEVSRRTGFAERSLRRWAQGNALPITPTRIGGRFYFQEAAVQKWEKHLAKFNPKKADQLCKRTRS